MLLPFVDHGREGVRDAEVRILAEGKHEEHLSFDVVADEA